MILFLQVWLAIVFIVWVRRIFWLGQFQLKNPAIEAIPAESSRSWPNVSVIVPARNEEANIMKCALSLSKQDYPNFEIIIVDDRSSDRTPALAEQFRNQSTVPVKVVRVDSLPQGWTGKNHAMYAGSREASGDWFLYTDADTTHKSQSVSSAVRTALDGQMDFLTLAPEVECVTFWEHVVQPLAVSSLALWFNTTTLNDPDSKQVLANGQFILVSKRAYEAIGGNACVKSEVVEDVELARRFKEEGFIVRFLNGTRLYSTRMYSSLPQIYNGWTRIFVHLFRKKILPVIHKIALFLFFSLFPFALFAGIVLQGLTGGVFFSEGLFWGSLGVSLFICAVRMAGNKRLHTNPWYGLLHPLGCLVMIWILCACALRIAFNRPSAWRGDVLK